MFPDFLFRLSASPDELRFAMIVAPIAVALTFVFSRLHARFSRLVDEYEGIVDPRTGAIKIVYLSYHRPTRPAGHFINFFAWIFLWLMLIAGLASLGVILRSLFIFPIIGISLVALVAAIWIYGRLSDLIRDLRKGPG